MGINNPTWYLCVLLLCYIIYYAIEVVSEKAHVSPNIVYFIVFLISFGGMYFGKSLPCFFTYQNQRGYTCFFSGVLLYNLIVKKISNNQVWLTVCGLAILTAFGVWRWGIGSWVVLVLFFYPLLVLAAVTIKQLPGYATRYLGGIVPDVSMACAVLYVFKADRKGFRNTNESYIFYNDFGYGVCGNRCNGGLSVL